MIIFMLYFRVMLLMLLLALILNEMFINLFSLEAFPLAGSAFELFIAVHFATQRFDGEIMKVEGWE